MANSDIIPKQVDWEEDSAEAPHVEPPRKRFVADSPALPQNFNWLMKRIYDLGINSLIDWISNYQSAQIYRPQDLTIPEVDGPTDRVYVDGDEQEAFILPSGQNGEVRLTAQMVRDEPDIVVVWSSPSAGDGSEAIHWLVEWEIVGDGDTPGTSSTQSTSTPTVPTTANEETQSTIDLGDLSGNKGKSLVLRVIRDGDNANDTSDQAVQLKRVEVR